MKSERYSREIKVHISQKNKANILSSILIIVLIIFGFSLLCGSFMKFEYIRAKLYSMFPYHCEKYFTEAIYKEIVSRTRIAGVIILFVSAAFFQFRKQIGRYIREVAGSFSAVVKELTNNLKGAFKGIGRVHASSLFIILMLGIGIRIYLLNQPMRYDEAVTFLRFASKPLYFGLSNYFSTNNHLFHTFLVHISYLLFGDALWAIRLPAFISGVLIIPASYVVIRAFYNKHAALLCSSVLAGSYIMASYSTNARGYTLLTLIVLILLGLADRLIQMGGKALWLIFSITAALGFYTMPVMLYAYGMVMVWLFITGIFTKKEGPRLDFIKSFFISLMQTGILTILLYLPVFIVSCFVTVKKVPSFRQGTLKYYIANIPSHLKQIFLSWNSGMPLKIASLLAIGFILCLIYHRRLSKYRLPIILAAAVWLIPLSLVYRVFPYPRTYIWFMPIFMGMGACGLIYPIMAIFKSKYIKQLKDMTLSIIAVLFAVLITLNALVMLPYFWSTESGTSWGAEETAIFLKEHLKPEDKVVAIVPVDRILEYYFNIHKIPAGHLKQEVSMDSSYNVYVVTNQDYTVEGILKEIGFEHIDSVKARNVYRYKETSLYKIESGKIAYE
ncbi:MAG: glycosyltransferase family 39 protein [Candidatus Omnitrophica bacterium]|nr:glycosyltransferase family 39 protein [Candidatus Omnitrophota bacterium]